MAMRVMVTGVGGQVGSCLARDLAVTGWESILLSRDELDISDREQVLARVAQFQPDLIINAAAYTAVDNAEAEVDLAYQINRDGPGYLAEAATAVDAAIFHISTDYVFSGAKTAPYFEQDATAPQSVYGQSKLEGEIAVAAACSKSLILRTSWVFAEVGGNFVKTMLRLGQDRSKLSVVSDQRGGPTYAQDISNALISLARRYSSGGEMTWGTYNYSGFPFVSWSQFSEEIFKRAEQESVLPHLVRVNPISTEEYPTPAKRPTNSCLDCTSIFEVYGIEPSNWQQALTGISRFTD